MLTRFTFLFLIFVNMGMGEAGAYLGSAAGMEGAPLRITASGCAIIQTPTFRADRSPSHIFCIG